MICSDCCGDHLAKDCAWSGPALEPDEKFDFLLSQWQENVKKIDAINEVQAELVEAIDSNFASIIRSKKMLADLPWEIESYRTPRLKTSVMDSAVQTFLDKLSWEEGRYNWHHSIKMNSFAIHLNDNVMEIYLNSIDHLMSFCEEHGIKPDMTKLSSQHREAAAKAAELSNIIEKLS